MDEVEQEGDFVNENEGVSFIQFNNKMVIPNDLEQNVVRKLKEENLINKSMQTKQIYWMAAAVVAIVVAFFGGRFTSAVGESSKGKHSYLLLLREDSSFSGTDIRKIIKEYSEWSNELRSKGQLSIAEKLTDQSYSYGTLPESHGPGVTGFFIIHADNLEQAQQIANSHPHLKYNGGVELRPIDQL